MSSYRFFEQFQDSVLVIDSEGRLLFGNTAASILLETSARRMAAGRILNQFVKLEPDVVGIGGSLSSVTEDTQATEVAFTLATGVKSGWVQVSIQPLPEPLYEPDQQKRDRYLINLRDVTLERTLHVKYRGELDKKEKVISELEIARAKLEEYSHQLEEKVRERTAELSHLNRLMKTILDSLAQGILVFDKGGICLPIYSAMCRSLFGHEPAGLPVEEIIGIEGNRRKSFADWRNAVFSEMLDLDDLKGLAPSTLKRAETGATLSFDYHPLRAENGELQGIVLSATDRTREVEAIEQAAEERRFVEKVVQLARNKPAFTMFVRDGRRILASLSEPTLSDRQQLMRDIHTLKGGSASFALKLLTRKCQALEDAIEKSDFRDLKDLRNFMATAAADLTNTFEDDLGEISELFGDFNTDDAEPTIEIKQSLIKRWSNTLKGVKESRTALEIAREIEAEALEKPVGNFVRHMGESLRELATSLGKKLTSFKIHGGDIRVPVQLCQPLLTSLVHAFRNSIYHGIESPAERATIGKSEGGTIEIAFAEDRKDGCNWLRIEIRDDGRGIDVARVRDRLNRIGQENLARKSDQEVMQAILLDGLSTNETADSIAGRGVGASAIASEAKRLGGSVSVSSIPAQGLIFQIIIPFPKVRDDSSAISHAAS